MSALNPVVVTEITTRQVAALVLSGANQREVAEQLGIGISQVRTIQKSEKFKAVLAEIGEQAVQEAKLVIKSQTSSMAKKIIKVINEQLDEGSLEAVKIGLKVLGLDQIEEKQQGDTNISVVLPGATIKKEIEVESGNVSEESEDSSQ